MALLEKQGVPRRIHHEIRQVPSNTSRNVQREFVDRLSLCRRFDLLKLNKKSYFSINCVQTSRLSYSVEREKFGAYSNFFKIFPTNSHMLHIKLIKDLSFHILQKKWWLPLKKKTCCCIFENWIWPKFMHRAIFPKMGSFRNAHNFLNTLYYIK